MGPLPRTPVLWDRRSQSSCHRTLIPAVTSTLLVRMSLEGELERSLLLVVAVPSEAKEFTRIAGARRRPSRVSARAAPLNFAFRRAHDRLLQPNRPLAGDLNMKWVSLLGVAAVVAAQPVTARESEAQIKEKIVKQSIDNYRGSCPCPYNSDRAGRSCGGRSAYSRPGGNAPKCYASDVTADDVERYRRRQ